MKKGLSWAFVVTCGLAVASPAGAQSPQPPRVTFSASIDLVSVRAIVKDRKGRFVRNLAREDFTVLDKGQPRRIVEFRPDDAGPVSLALLFDVSGSMRVGTKVDEARHAADHVLTWLESGKDEAAVFSFDTSLRELQPFTTDAMALHRAIETLEPYGATSLFDAMAAAARQLAGRSAGRRALVVFSDGMDTSSRLTPSDVSGLASSIDVPVYLIVVGSWRHWLEPDEASAGSPEDDLRDLATWTGGTMFVASTPAQASVAARQLVTELRHQYLIAFEAASAPGWRPLDIRTRDPQLVVHARSGYVAGRSRRGE